MAVHIAKSMITGIVATVVGGLILIFILREMGFFHTNLSLVELSEEKTELSNSFSFYSPELTFFESGAEVPDRQNRIYTDSFSASSARFINWELKLYHAVLEMRTPVSFLVVYAHSDGKEFGRAQYDNFAEAGWNSSLYSWSWGSNEAGVWKPDTYTVEIFYRGNSVIREQFVIY